MGSPTLTSAAQLKCPHGATITATPTETNVTIKGAQPLKVTDTFTVAGCPFTIPAGPATIPSPCTVVIWTVPNLMTLAGQTPLLSQSSVGLCIGLIGVQGTVMVSSAGQSVVTST